MRRRRFLVNIITWLAGSFLGLDRFSNALASGGLVSKGCIQPRIALIIDDIGCRRSIVREFLKINAPITYAVLPRMRRSSELAEEIYQLGHEVMLHQPMEPHNVRLYDPGPGALFVGDGPIKIERIIEENISAVPFAAGMNNHMGSKFTECAREIHETLDAARRKGLFFVDSCTSRRSIAYQTARRLNMPSAGSKIFIDNILDESAILARLRQLKKYACQHGCAIGIGHPFTKTARAILRFKQDLAESGITLVYASEVLNSDWLHKSRNWSQIKPKEILMAGPQGDGK